MVNRVAEFLASHTLFSAKLTVQNTVLRAKSWKVYASEQSLIFATLIIRMEGIISLELVYLYIYIYTHTYTSR